SGDQKGRQGHFRNLVMLARIDGKIDAAELALLNRMARRLSLTDDQVKEICEHESDYPMVPPVSREERYERFIRFVQMVLVDGTVSKEERDIVIKYGVALGMDENKVSDQFDQVVANWLNGMDASDILDAML